MTEPNHPAKSRRVEELEGIIKELERIRAVLTDANTAVTEKGVPQASRSFQRAILDIQDAIDFTYNALMGARQPELVPKTKPPGIRTGRLQ